MADESRRFTRRCPACGSSAERGAKQCGVCGEALSWRLRRRGILIESGLVVLAVLVAVGGMLWLRERPVPGEAPARIVGRALIDREPTDLPTYTAAPPATATEAPNTPFPPTATPLPETITHVVASGDTLYGIAIEYGVTLDAIVEFNQLSNTHSLSIGQELLVPVNPSGAPAVAEAQPEVGAEDDALAEAGFEGGAEDVGEAEAADTSAEVSSEEAPAEAALEAPARASGELVTLREAEVYRVQPGDNLGGIAVTHDLAVEDLMSLNGLAEGATLSIGQELVIRPAEVGTATPPPPPPTIPSTLSEAGAPVVAEVERDSSYPAPRLLSPGRATVVGAEAPLLRWSSSGVLAEEVYYVVSIRSLPEREDGVDAGADGAMLLPVDDPSSVGDVARIAEHDAEAELEWVYSKSTALRVPARFRPAFGSQRRLEWSVTVRRRGGGGLIGEGAGEILSPVRRRQLWTFTWAPGESLPEQPDS